MAAAGAVISGVSAVGGLIGAGSKAKAQKRQIDEQVRSVETQRMLNRMEATSQRQSLELNDQRQRDLLAQQEAITLLNNDLSQQQAELQRTQAQIDTDREAVLNNQRVFQRKAAANQQAAQVFNQLSQQSKQQQGQYDQARSQQAQQESGMSGSKTTGSSVSAEAASERLALAIENGQIDTAMLYDRAFEEELRQLGYEYNIADIEQRLGQSGIDYQNRDLGRVGELTGLQANANRTNIATQTKRNNSALDYELATNRGALSQAEASNEVNTNAQISGLQYQRKAASGPGVFEWATTLGGIGLNVYNATRPQQAQQNKNNFVFRDTRNPGNKPQYPDYGAQVDTGVGAPSYMPYQVDTGVGAPAAYPRALDSSVADQAAFDYGARVFAPQPFTPYEMVFNRPEAYNTGRKLSTSVFRR